MCETLSIGDCVSLKMKEKKNNNEKNKQKNSSNNTSLEASTVYECSMSSFLMFTHMPR